MTRGHKRRTRTSQMDRTVDGFSRIYLRLVSSSRPQQISSQGAAGSCVAHHIFLRQHPRATSRFRERVRPVLLGHDRPGACRPVHRGTPVVQPGEPPVVGKKKWSLALAVQVMVHEWGGVRLGIGRGRVGQLHTDARLSCDVGVVQRRISPRQAHTRYNECGTRHPQEVTSPE